MFLHFRLVHFGYVCESYVKLFSKVSTPFVSLAKAVLADSKEFLEQYFHKKLSKVIFWEQIYFVHFGEVSTFSVFCMN